MVASGSQILVFGGGGQLGLDLVRTASKRGFALRALPRSNADISDSAAVTAAISAWNPSLVVNAAAYTKVDDAEIERENAERANVTGPAVLARACEAAKIPLIHISSDYVFDGTKTGAYAETDQVAPTGFYGWTKARGEDAVRSATARHIILRVSWLFGEFGQNFLKTMLRLAGERDELRVVADQHGSPTSTRDLANAILTISKNIAAGTVEFGTYHFAGDGVTTWYGFADSAVAKFRERTGRKVTVRAITAAEYPARTKRPANSALDCGKFERVFGFRGRPWHREVEEITEVLLLRQQQSSKARKDGTHA
jgi:dTDP-4-dehydrorhamnose reductase